MAALKHRLGRSLDDLEVPDKSQQGFFACLSLVEREVDSRDMKMVLTLCLKDMSKSSKAAAKFKLLIIAQALLIHGFSLNQEDVSSAFELLLHYASSQVTAANTDELRRVTDALMTIFLNRLVDALMSSMTLLSGVQDDEVRRLEACLTERILGGPTNVLSSNGGRGGRGPPASSYLILDQMIECCKAFVHVKIVVDSCATILDHKLLQGNLPSDVPEVLLPIQRAVELLSIGLKPKTCSKIVNLGLKSGASKIWQVREQAFLLFASLASSVVMEDPLYHNEHPRKIVMTPAVKAVSELRPAIAAAIEIGRFDRIPSVRASAHRALLALDGLPPPLVSPGMQPSAHSQPVAPNKDAKTVPPAIRPRQQQRERKRWSADVSSFQERDRAMPSATMPRVEVEVRRGKKPPVQPKNSSKLLTKQRQPIDLSRKLIDLARKPRAAIYSAIDQASEPRHPFLRADKDKAAVQSHSLQWESEARISRPRPLPRDMRDFGIIILAKPKPPPPPPFEEPPPPPPAHHSLEQAAFTFHLDQEGEGSPVIHHHIQSSPARDTAFSIHVYSSPERTITTADRGVATEASAVEPHSSESFQPTASNRSQGPPPHPPSSPTPPLRGQGPPGGLLGVPHPPSYPTRSSPSISLSVSIHNNVLPPSMNGIGRGREGGTESHSGPGRGIMAEPSPFTDRGEEPEDDNDTSLLHPVSSHEDITKTRGRSLDFKSLVMQATSIPHVMDSIREEATPVIVDVKGEVVEVVYGEGGKTPAASPPLEKVDPLEELAGMMARLEALRHHLTSQQPGSNSTAVSSSSPIRYGEQPPMSSSHRPRAWQEDVALGNRYGVNRGSPSASVTHVTRGIKSPTKSPSSSPVAAAPPIRTHLPPTFHPPHPHPPSTPGVLRGTLIGAMEAGVPRPAGEVPFVIDTLGPLNCD